MDLNLSAKSFQCEPRGYQSVDLNIQDVEESDVLDQFTVEQVINHFGVSDILDKIGESDVFDHFDIERE